jgi:Zn finger protein HypA/HybF involved in hydrogenase expression
MSPVGALVVWCRKCQHTHPIKKPSDTPEKCPACGAQLKFDFEPILSAGALKMREQKKET